MTLTQEQLLALINRLRDRARTGKEMADLIEKWAPIIYGRCKGSSPP